MEDRLEVLEAIERGDISVQEGLRRLEGDGDASRSAGEMVNAPSPVVRPFLVRVIWQSVFWGAVTLTAVGGVLVSAFYAWSISPGWRVLGWVLLGLGVVATMVGWWMRTARWLSVRIREAEGTKINLAFPLPLGLVYWALRIARTFVPQIRDVPLEETVVALEESLRAGDPFVVDIRDEDSGDHVQVSFA